MLIDLIRNFLLILAAASACYFLVSMFACRKFFSAPSPACRSEEAGSRLPQSCRPPVSILIPLCGADFRAYENYASLCRQDYPEFQIAFGVAHPEDSSVALVNKLKSDFPQIPIDLVVSANEIGPNPKVSNLNNILPHARHELLVMLDSDIRVGPDFLKTVADELIQNGGGVITCLYRAGAAPGLPSKLEAVGITAEFAPGVLVAQMAGGISFAFGAAIVFSKKTLAALGGFPAIAAFLADDYMIGNLARKSGLPVNLSRYVVETVLSRLSMRAFLRHQVRWARGIRACNPWGHTGSVVTNGTVIGFLYLLLSGFAGWGWLVFPALLALRLAMAYFLGVRCLNDTILEKNIFLVPVRDIFSFFIWCAALFGSKVEWREKTFRLEKDGRMRAVSSEQ
ncbi:MAG: bacteriohopanetetrol glucosamine biosynthesis glycosyltransferase HpnI [Syntrophobacteraceae bacterium]